MTILIVDDDPLVLRFMATALEAEGYEALRAPGGDEALALCESHQSSLDLMISDVAMPRMNGRALGECMNTRYPGVPIVFVSGYPESREILAGLTARGYENGYRFLQKPFTASALLKAVRAALQIGANVRACAV